MAMNKYSRHAVDILEELDKGLKAVVDKTDQAREEYRRLLGLAKDSGFMSDYTDVLAGDLFSEFSRLLDDINGLVERERARIPRHKDLICDLELAARLRNV